MNSRDDLNFSSTKQDKSIDIYNKDQLNLEISTNKLSFFSNTISNIKLALKKRKEEVEISVLWKNIIFPLLLTSIVFSALIFKITYIFNFYKIPPKVPLVYNHIQQSWELVDKIVLAIFFIFIVVIEILFLSISLKIFKLDRRFTITIWWLVFIMNILFLVGISQIFNLIT